MIRSDGGNSTSYKSIRYSHSRGTNNNRGSMGSRSSCSTSISGADQCYPVASTCSGYPRLLLLVVDISGCFLVDFSDCFYVSAAEHMTISGALRA